jgi:hypothetical protein
MSGSCSARIADNLPRRPRKAPDAEALAAAGLVGAVRDVSLDVRKARSSSSWAQRLRASHLAALPVAPDRADRGRVVFEGRDLLKAGEREMIEIRRTRWGWCSELSPCCRTSVFSTTSPFRSRIQGVDQGVARARAGESDRLVGLRAASISTRASCRAASSSASASPAAWHATRRSGSSTSRSRRSIR